MISEVLKKEIFNLDLVTMETDRLIYTGNDTAGWNLEKLNCTNARGCTKFTIDELVVPIFKKNRFTIEFPEEKFDQNFECSKMVAYIYYLNHQKVNEIIAFWDGSNFQLQKKYRRCSFMVDLKSL